MDVNLSQLIVKFNVSNYILCSLAINLLRLRLRSGLHSVATRLIASCLLHFEKGWILIGLMGLAIIARAEEPQL